MYASYHQEIAGARQAQLLREARHDQLAGLAPERTKRPSLLSEARALVAHLDLSRHIQRQRAQQPVVPTA